MAKWAGPDQLGQDMYDGLQNTAKTLAETAAMMRAERNGTDEAIELPNVTHNVMLVAQSYLDRFQINYTNRGSAWGSDADFKSDLDVCTLLSSGEQR